MNAPVPPANEPETLKQQSQYQATYNQSFSSQPHQVEQTELQQDQLQTGKKARVTFFSVLKLPMYALLSNSLPIFSFELLLNICVPNLISLYHVNCVYVLGMTIWYWIVDCCALC